PECVASASAPVALTSSASAGSSGAAIAEDIRPTLAVAATARDAIVRLVRRANVEDMLFSPFPCSGTSVRRLHVACDMPFSILIIVILRYGSTNGSHRSRSQVPLDGDKRYRMTFSF